MTLIELLQLGQSRKNIDQIVEMASNDKRVFDELWKIFVSLKEPESRRAAWAIDILNEANCLVIGEEHIIQLIDNLEKCRHDGLKRHSLRIIESHDLIAEKIGVVTSVCFNWLENPTESVAVKMYSLKILSKIAMMEPEIIRELIDLIEIQMDEATPGFRNIGYKTIIELRKSMQSFNSRMS